MDYFFSASTSSFYPLDMRAEYEAVGSWPDDAIAVDADCFQAFGLQPPPPGKVRGAGSDGLPAWLDQPAPSAEQILQMNTGIRDSLLGTAATRIAPLQDAADLGIATAEEAASLTAWKQYRVALSRLDMTASATDWPTVPA